MTTQSTPVTTTDTGRGSAPQVHLLRAARLGVLGGATACILLSLPASEWLIDGWRPHRIWPAQGAVLLAVGWCWFRVDRRTAGALVGAGMVGGLLVLAMSGVQEFAPSGVGLGPRVPLVICAAFFLALHGGLAGLEMLILRRRPASPPSSRTWWPTVITVVALVTCAAVTWTAVTAGAARVNDHHRFIGANEPPPADQMAGTVAGVGGQFESVTSSEMVTVVTYDEPRPLGLSVDVPTRTVVAAVVGPPSPVSGRQSQRWTSARAGAPLLDDPVLSPGRVYLRYVQWGFLGTDSPMSPDSRAAADKTIVVLDADTGAVVDEFDPPSGSARIADAADDHIVFVATERRGVELTVTDGSGHTRWQAQAPAATDRDCRLVTGGLAGDRVVVSSVCDNLIRVGLHDADTGDLLWERDLGAAVATCGATAFRSETTLVISTCEIEGDTPANVLVGLDPATGAEYWRKLLPDLRVDNHALPPNFYTSDYAVTYRTGDGVVVANRDGLTVIDPASGEQTAVHDIALADDVLYPAVYPTNRGVVVASAAWHRTGGPTPIVWID